VKYEDDGLDAQRHRHGHKDHQEGHGSNYAPLKIRPRVAEKSLSVDFQPPVTGSGMPTNVAALVYDGVSPFERGGL
jgi:hypothetical protein